MTSAPSPASISRVLAAAGHEKHEKAKTILGVRGEFASGGRSGFLVRKSFAPAADYVEVLYRQIGNSSEDKAAKNYPLLAETLRSAGFAVEVVTLHGTRTHSLQVRKAQ